MINNEFIVEIPWLEWNKQNLLDYMYSNKLKWTVGNLFFRPLETPKVIKEIIDQLPALNLDVSRSMFARCSPGEIIPPHIDPGRQAGIYFPLEGDFINSPIEFLKDYKGIINYKDRLFQHVYTVPTLLNTSRLHYVINHSKLERITFSLTCINLNWKTSKEIVSNLNLTTR